MKNRNVNTHFNSNPVNLNMPRSRFNRDHSVKFDCNHGDLVPFYVDEVLPGDTVDITTSKLIRTMPLVSPIYDEIFCDVYYFFVPYRLLWSKFLEFMGEATEDTTVDPGSIVGEDLTIPKIYFPQSGSSHKPFAVHSIADYFGLPTTASNISQGFNVLPFRAYNKIFNDWFRAESFENPRPTMYENSGDYYPPMSFQSPCPFGETGNMYPFKANKTFDYFTSCLTSPQRGPNVGILAPEQNVPVYFGMQDNPLLAGGVSTDLYFDDYDNVHIKTPSSDGSKWITPTTAHPLGYSSSGDFEAQTLNKGSTSVSLDAFRDAMITNAQVNLSGHAMTINQLRDAFAVQRYYEKLNRSGSRYISQVKAFFGVDSPDARLQRSEYLGGTRIYLDISQVTQTSGTTSVSPQGNLTGNSVTGDVHSDVHKSFYEHGLLMGIACFRNHHTYQQGVEKFWFKSTLFDIYNPTFASIGEQPVYKREINFVNNDASNNLVFGYNEAWADYRYKPSRTCGLLRSGVEGSLDIWHLADYYDDTVSLSKEWLRETDDNLKRVLSVQDTSQYLCDFYLKSTWTRVMPLYSVPGLLDHN